MKKIFTILLMSVLLSSCSSMVKELMQAPQVKGIQLKSFSAKNKSVIFDVDLYNPNAYALPVSGLSGNMMLNQLVIGSIEAESDQSLAAHTSQIVSVPIQLDTDALINAAKSVLSNQQAHYNFNGGIKTPVGKIPFSKSGDLSIQEILSTLLR